MTLSKEELQQIAADGFIKHGDAKVMAAELLDRRERDGQEFEVTDAMALAFHHAITDGCAGSDEIEEIKAGLRATLSNYTAPPAPVVPEEMPHGMAGQIVSLLSHNIGDKFLAQKIWKACRAAMLQSFGNSEQLQAEQQSVSQSYKLVGEVVAWDHPNKERSIDFRWLNYDVAPGTKLYAMGKE